VTARSPEPLTLAPVFACFWLPIVSVAALSSSSPVSEVRAPADEEETTLEQHAPATLAGGSSRTDLGRDPVPSPPVSSEQPKKSGNVIVPVLLYTPETHFGVGGLFIHLFRLKREADARLSSIAVVGMITTRRQAVLEVHPDIYWASDDLHVFGKVEYQKYPDSFWGIGNSADDATEERYERTRLRYRPVVQLRIAGHAYAGLFGDAMWFRGEYLDPDGIFANETIPGEDGGITVGLGPTVTFDSRDNTVATVSGWLVNATFTEFSPTFGSRYSFRKFQLDARWFTPTAYDQVLAVHGYSEVQGKDVPYYHLGMLGGDELLRGYYLGRYRDENLVALDLEYRVPVYWRFGAVAFGGAGMVSEQLRDLPAAPVRWAVGTGLRFAVNQEEHLNLRLDFGIGPDTHGLYFTAREAF
jgi:hypothetical protein